MRTEWKVSVDKEVYADISAYNEVMAREIEVQIVPSAIKALQEPIAYWKSQPSFHHDIEKLSEGYRITIWPGGYMGRIWDYHVQGVEGRTITPRFKKALDFSPHNLAPNMDSVTVAAVYNWKGIEPREDTYINLPMAEYSVPFMRRLGSVVHKAFNALQGIFR